MSQSTRGDSPGKAAAVSSFDEIVTDPEFAAMVAKLHERGPIKDEAERLAYFEKAKSELFKEAEELYAEYGIDVCVVCDGPPGANPDIFTSNPDVSSLLARLPEGSIGTQMTEWNQTGSDREILIERLVSGEVTMDQLSAREVASLKEMLDSQMESLNRRMSEIDQDDTASSSKRDDDA